MADTKATPADSDSAQEQEQPDRYPDEDHSRGPSRMHKIDYDKLVKDDIHVNQEHEEIHLHETSASD